MWTLFFLLGLVPPLFLSVLLFHPLISLPPCFFWLSDFVARDSHGHFGLFTAVLSFNPTYADARSWWRLVDSAKAHADQLAAKLGRDRSAHEILGRFVRVTDEDGEEVYRAPLTNRV